MQVKSWRMAVGVLVNYLLSCGLFLLAPACSDSSGGTAATGAGQGTVDTGFQLDGLSGETQDAGLNGGDLGTAADSDSIGMNDENAADSAPDAFGSSDSDQADTGPDSGDAGADTPDTQADSATKDGTQGPADDFGAPCKSDDDCSSQWCIEGYSGYFCSQTCAGSCPSGYVCQKVYAGQAATYLCVAPVNKLCKPCSADIDCGGGICVKSGSEQYCATPCGGAAGGCPDSHACKKQDNPDGTPGPTVCLPNTGSCSCTAATSGLVRACQQSGGPKTCYGVEICQNSQWGSCQLPAESCNGQDDDCNGVVDDGFVDGAGKYTTLQACGQCGINCAVLQAPNAKGICDTSSGPALCKLACDAGWHDVNDNPKDGCECTVISATDEPDGPDQNCDGIDGEVDNGIFVALTGSDANDGSMLAPLQTISKAIDLAVKKSKRDVYAATGVYDGSLTLHDGVHVYGGYSPNFKQHDPKAYETVVIGGPQTSQAPGAINALDLKGSAAFDGFTVYGASTKSKGASTYAIYVRDCGEGLKIEGNQVIAGDAGGGLAGAAGTNGQAGTAGFSGVNAKDIGAYACSATYNSAGGKGGLHTCGGIDVSGGQGGTSVCPDYDEDGTQPKSSPYKQTLSAAEQGTAGKGTAVGIGGASGYDSIIYDGSGCSICTPPKLKDGDPFLYTTGNNGADGGDGMAGGAGAGCGQVSGQVVGTQWLAAVSADGGVGAPGGGGGGGGAGGGVEVTSTCTVDKLFKYPDIGGSGGGAGAGGCGGSQGKAGGGGGGSFALFLLFTQPPAALPTFTDNILVTGNGGDGGSGGQGGVGGVGGDGKFGGGDDPTGLAWCASGGGRGGQGGNGGHGGGGGGGCGGVSFGLFVYGQGALNAGPLNLANTIQVLGLPGSGGAGGKSLGKTGSDGAVGAGGAVNF